MLYEYLFDQFLTFVRRPDFVKIFYFKLDTFHGKKLYESAVLMLDSLQLLRDYEL